MPNNSTFVTYILIGGKSSRFGTDKLQFVLDGKSILDHVIESVSDFSTEIILVGNQTEKYNPDFNKISDHILFDGPLSGIFSVLSDSTETDKLILAGDMPFLKKTELENYLKEVKKMNLILIPETSDQQQHFLHVMIKKEWCKKLIQILNENQDLKSVHRLWEKFGTEIYHVPDEWKNHYRNINQKSDLEI